MSEMGVSKSVRSVEFSFLKEEELRRMSVVKIVKPILVDSVDRPVSGGLYDPLLGPYHEESCKTCGQRSFNCPGHCGHIELVLPAYNPLLISVLYKLLQRICFSCYRLRTDSDMVKHYVSKLELIIKGDIAGAKGSIPPSESFYPEDSDISHESYSTIHSPSPSGSDHLQKQQWSSLQLTEAMSVLNSLLKKQYKKCKNCKASNPRISNPNYGLFYLGGMSNADIRANVIEDCHLGELSSVDSEEITDVEDTIQTPGKKWTTRKKPLKEQDKAALYFRKQKNMLPRKLLPSEVKKIIELFWEKETQLCSYLSDIQQQRIGSENAGSSMFFLQTILVPPIKFRPPTKGGDSAMDHPQTVLLNKVLQSNISLGAAYAKKEPSKIVDRWWELQQSINVLFDSKTAQGGSAQKDVASGICQILERKEGLFRQKMMGKRVNYACRSVISPDPYLDVNEIGIPPCFAVKLTYPERVTPWNAAQLRNAVINGSENHPGAIQYVDKLSTNRLPPSRKARISIARKLPSSRGAVAQPGKSSDYEYDGKIVYRHLRDGDIVLVNRQPTLHKISMMAHKVRVLNGEKTLRMHYANCSTYNADFDGDEMNVHFPQDEVSRAEAYNIVNANNQYVKPSNGEPIRGLIQDHIVSAALLTNMDSFLTGDQFVQLLHSSGIFGSGRNSFSCKPGQKVIFSLSEDDIQIPPPALSKPVDRWTGKQVITALLNHITKGHPPFTVEKGGKIPHDFFKSRTSISCARNNGTDGGGKDSKETEIVNVIRRKKLSCEDKMLIKGNYLVQGVIDKAQFGEHGLVHTVHELYGSDTAGLLLSALSRLFTAFLQMHGFTCGVDDLLIMKAKDDERKYQLENSEKCGELVHRNFIGIKDENIKIDLLALQLNIEKTIRSDGESALGYLDRQMTSELASRTSSGVINELLSDGLLKASGKNCISLMTTSGAKGSKINFQQISSFLGQQELEGKRVPRMVSGKTLPCFHPWDWDARAGGFIIDRFLTGLRPQEYYFHCMAGREGLVDTAVKTSRSGYLQRCLIKNLECLKISYDHTVRDADGSIVQFCYGDDGVDVHRTSFVTKFDTLTANQEMICQKYDQLEAFNSYIVEPTDALKERAKKFVNSSELNERNGELRKRRKELTKLVKQKYFSSLAQPGEPVGVLAAQSVGEPSTQMTLNTFHLAGRGEMNVTLGIPRLQEILMTASSDIKTPIMTCPLQRERTEKDADLAVDKLKKVTVADVIESMKVDVMPFEVQNDEFCRIYNLTMKLFKPAHYPQYTDISVEDWEETLEVVFVRQLEDAIENHMVLLSRISGIKDLPETHSRASNETEEGVTNTSTAEENDDENDEMVVDDIGADAEKRRLQSKDDREYDDEEEQDEDGDESSAVASEDEISKDDITGTGISQSPGVTNNGEPKSRKKASKSRSQRESDSKQESSDSKLLRAKRKKRVRAKLIKKDFDRAIFVEAKGFDLRIHFKFTNEPHILLAEIAQETATKVYIQNPGKIERCRVTNCKEKQVIYYGEDAKKRVDVEPAEKEKTPALHTTGVDFSAFWEMEDQLDLRYLYSNDIHAMLRTYGVEAARETIIREVKHVFGSYGISVNTRHLSLIADFMTHAGGYRPMSRLGGIAESISPFCKMSFETASKFIVKAALHGESDNLEAPSASICLGLPVKMGTGSFGLMQNLEI